VSSTTGHCASYYAATRNDNTEYPSLKGDSDTDVCVIGGGFTGIATALMLAERGYRVTLLEQYRIGWGASGRNGGQVIGGLAGEDRLRKFWGDSHAQALHQLAYRGHDIIADWVRRYGIDCDLKYGYMDVALKPRHLAQQRAWFEELCGQGMQDQLRLIDGRELRDLLGTEAYLGGLINRRNGHLHPLNLCLGEARAAAGLGVQIHEETPVTDIIHARRPVVVTQRGRVAADFVVLAGNAYHALERRALSALQFPAGTYIVATEPLSEQEVAEINPEDLAVCDQNEMLDYFRLSADRRMLFGGRCNYSGRVPRSIEAAIVPRMKKIYPQLADKRIDYAWGGRIGIVINRVPLVGRVGASVFYSQGYSGHGVNMTHACGEMLADAISGTLESMDLLARVPHRRLPLGQKLGGQLVAMGMLYYRLRDML
jgi:glycine/D-amino acid oxidase-like deaminating enzyme